MTAKDMNLIFKTVYERTHGGKYLLLSRDFGEAKRLLELNPDLESDDIEPRVLQYFKTKNEFVITKKYPAWCLWMQFNEHTPGKVKAERKYYQPDEVITADPERIKKILSDTKKGMEAK